MSDRKRAIWVEMEAVERVVDADVPDLAHHPEDLRLYAVLVYCTRQYAQDMAVTSAPRVSRLAGMSPAETADAVARLEERRLLRRLTDSDVRDLVDARLGLDLSTEQAPHGLKTALADLQEAGLHAPDGRAVQLLACNGLPRGDDHTPPRYRRGAPTTSTGHTYAETPYVLLHPDLFSQREAAGRRRNRACMVARLTPAEFLTLVILFGGTRLSAFGGVAPSVVRCSRRGLGVGRQVREALARAGVQEDPAQIVERLTSLGLFVRMRVPLAPMDPGSRTRTLVLKDDARRASRDFDTPLFNTHWAGGRLATVLCPAYGYIPSPITDGRFLDALRDATLEHASPKSFIRLWGWYAHRLGLFRPESTRRLLVHEAAERTPISERSGVLRPDDDACPASECPQSGKPTESSPQDDPGAASGWTL